MEEASVAGESPDRSKQRESSAEPTSGSASPVPGARSSAPDPRLAVARESISLGGLDTATKVFSVRDLPKTPEDADESPAEAGTDGSGTGEPEDAPPAAERRPEPARTTEATDPDTPTPDDTSTPDGPEDAVPEDGPEDAPEDADATDAPEDAAPAEASKGSGTAEESEDSGAAEGADESGTSETPEDTGAAERSDDTGTTGTTDAPDDSDTPGGSEHSGKAETPNATDTADGSGDTGTADAPEDARPAEDSHDTDTADGPGDTGTTDAPEDPRAAKTPDDPRTADGLHDTGTTDAPEDARPAEDSHDTGTADAPDDTDTPEGSEDSGDAKTTDDADTADGPDDSGTAKTPEDTRPATEDGARGSGEREEPAAAGDARLRDAVAAWVAKGDGSGKDATAGDTEEDDGAGTAVDDEPAPSEARGTASRTDDADVEDTPPVDQPTAVFKAPRPAVDQPTTMLKLGRTPEAEPEAEPKPKPKPKPEADAERTSRFVALKALDEPRPKPDVTAAVPQVGPERTTQQPLPPKPPLDLLAELTNTPPPPPSPLRTLGRRVKIWTPLVILLVVAFAIAQALRPLPDPTLSLTAEDSYTFDGSEASLPWPTQGQGWMDVNGVGTMGNFGKQTPVAIGSVAKAMTAYIVLKDHPLKSGAEGPKITVDALAEKEGGYNKQGESTLNTVKQGDVLTQRQAIAAIMIPSANNIARLLARWDAGSEAAFIKKMNDTAQELGMKNTKYTDASGLKETTVSSAEDQVKLGNELVKIPALMEITSMGQWVDPSGQKWYNYNYLVPYTGIGIKTGTTSAAGGNLLFASRKEVGGETVTVVGAILGQHKAPIIKTVNDVSKVALLAAEDALKSAKILKKGDVVGYVDDGLGGHTPVVLTKDVTAVGWAGFKVKLSFTADEVPHTAKAGTKVGSLTVGDGKGGAVKVPVTLQKDLTEPGLTDKLTRVG
ncbi:D-alanyl-D-alanine carboxypeptidase [Streptomyces pseudovenezuelae]|uniref:D-alanyl-D-alanine carboxypeptidase n=1 Tax=Streptomyces pseudovenezuelae TaxID=67350 RepID=UPI002E81FE63|nr:D-alanyl-D-alanine carboxypeptidase [Streptomyces pseudovenezuelae]WUA94230.1 D-alanyl-D-alanine carboxypeptidase [Streptomyces pseudovenezuelae]